MGRGGGGRWESLSDFRIAYVAFSILLGQKCEVVAALRKKKQALLALNYISKHLKEYHNHSLFSVQ